MGTWQARTHSILLSPVPYWQDEMLNTIPDSTLDLVFAALSDRTRRAILDRLTQGSANVTELAGPFKMSLPAISKHLHILEKAGLISRSIEGRVHHLRLAADRLHEVSAWLEHYRQFWEHNLDSLNAYLEATAPDTTAPDTPVSLSKVPRSTEEPS